MTPPRSSTSSSEARRYLGALFGTAATLAVLLAAVTIPAYRLGLVDVENSALVDLQRRKVEAAPRVDILFLGDSSLGNAIDAGLVSELSGRSALNLALTGAYGFGGSYNLLRKVLERQRPQLVVVFQTLDMLSRPQSPAGLYFTSDGVDLSEVTPLDVMKIYLNFGVAKRAYRSLQATGWTLSRSPQLTNDYVRAASGVGRASLEERIQRPLDLDRIHPEAMRQLGRIASLCREHALRCVYAFGPIFEGYCQSERDYVDRAARAIRETGLSVVAGTPVCIPRAELGDTIDHVAPEKEDAYTRRYYELLDAAILDGALTRR
jgi:hypothetical protein